MSGSLPPKTPRMYRKVEPEPLSEPFALPRSAGEGATWERRGGGGREVGERRRVGGSDVGETWKGGTEGGRGEAALGLLRVADLDTASPGGRAGPSPPPERRLAMLLARVRL
jgi:hypothetical protein